MSLATRCPACGTVFRVVQDQLKVSEGWVRCGRCSEVFNAVDGLFDLEAQALPATQAAPGHGHGHGPDTSDEPDHPHQATPIADAAIAPLAPAPDESIASADAAAAAHVSAGLAPPSQGGELLADDDARAIELHAEASQPTPAEELAAACELPPLEGADAHERIDTPDFVRRADAAARWRHPALRGMLALCALLLAALLAAQLALYYRDGLAASWPPARTTLAWACARLGCRIEAPRRIDSLSVESSSLKRIADGALYQLQLVLRNRANVAVRMPAIDFALTDARGQTTARRVLQVSDFGQAAQVLPPLGELPLSGTLDLGDRPVAGYTVELFYP